MIGIIVIAIILYEMFGKNNPAVRSKIKGYKELIVFAIIAYVAIKVVTVVIGSVFNGVMFTTGLFGLSGLFGAFGLIGGLISIASVAIPIIVIVMIVKGFLEGFDNGNKSEKNNTIDGLVKEQVKGQSGFKMNNATMQMGMKNTYKNFSFDNRAERLRYLKGAVKLNKSESKRMKIVQKFNKKFDLNLRDSEIETIVKASYMDFGWEREVADMARDYNSESEWYKSGPAIWLRAYLHAFNVQSVSSDFNMQRQVVYDSFVNVFECINPADCTSVDDCIKRINDRFYTSFDDITFMIAYNFLEANGRHYELPKVNIMAEKDELADLKKKYDETKKKYEEEEKENETPMPGL